MASRDCCEDKEVAAIQAQAHIYSTDKESTAAVAVAKIQAEAEVEAARLHAEAVKESRTEQAEAAAITGKATVEAASIDARSRTESAAIQAKAQTDASATVAAADIQSAGIQAAAQTAAAASDAQSRAAAAQAAANAQIEAAAIMAAADTQSAATQATAQAQAAESDARSRVEAALASADAQVQSAQLGANAERDSARIRADADIEVAKLKDDHEVEVANIDAQGRRDVATIGGQFSVQTADKEGVWRENVSEVEKGASNYRADREYDGVVYHENHEDSRLATKLGFANDKFASILPLIEQMVGASSELISGGLQGVAPQAAQTPNPRPMGFGASMSMGAGSNVSLKDNCGDQMGHYSSMRMGPPTPAPRDGGQGGGGSSVTGVIPITAPYITTRGVLTPGQLQEQVNRTYARHDALVASRIRTSEGDLAGRGFAAHSPLLDAIKVGHASAGLRASFEAASKIRLDAAQANTDAVHRAQVARSDQYKGQQDILVDYQRNEYTRQVGILSAISQLVSGII